MFCESGMFFFSSRRRHTRLQGDWSSDVCSSDLASPPDRVTALFLGVDAGASHCTAVIGRGDLAVLGRAAGPAAAMHPGAAAAVAAVIADTARPAPAPASVPLPVARAVLGAAGARPPPGPGRIPAAVPRVRGASHPRRG